MTDRAPGWILLHRSMVDPLDRFWNDGSKFDTRAARIDLLFLARFAAGDVVTPRGADAVNRGEFVASLRFLERRWRWSKDRVSRYLIRCADDGFLVRQRQGHNGIVYLVANYDRYQSLTEFGATDANRKRGQQRDGNKDSEPDKDKEGINKETPIGRDERLIGFARCWAIYPRRKGGNSKQGAEAAYLARVRAGVDEQYLYVRTLAYKSACEAAGKIGTEFVLMAKTFYGKDRRYDDDFGTPDGNATDAAMTPMPGARDAEDARKLRLAGF